MAHVCECGKPYGDAKSLLDHTQSAHLGYRFYCSRCGAGPWTNKSAGVGHRKRNVACNGAKNLTFRPGFGFFFGAQPFVGELPVVLQHAYVGAAGGEADAVADGAVDVVAEVVGGDGAATPPLALLAPAPPPLISPLRPLVLPQGIFCTMCPSVDGRYVEFADPLALSKHLIGVHIPQQEWTAISAGMAKRTADYLQRQREE